MKNVDRQALIIRKWIENCNIKNEQHRRALGRGVVLIYRQQTADEQRDRSTKHENGVGFNGADAEYLSSIAQFFSHRGYISEKQAAITKKKLKKYAKQIATLQKHDSLS